jgi:hypothetical protein
MGLDYFKGWMEGFAAGIGDAPTPEQWAKVLAVLAKTSDGIGLLPATPYTPLYLGIGAWRSRDTSASVGVAQ